MPGQGKEGIAGRFFFLETDCRDGQAIKMDKTGKALLTLLRHLKRTDEVQSGPVWPVISHQTCFPWPLLCAVPLFPEWGQHPGARAQRVKSGPRRGAPAQRPGPIVALAAQETAVYSCQQAGMSQ